MMCALIGVLCGLAVLVLATAVVMSWLVRQVQKEGI